MARPDDLQTASDVPNAQRLQNLLHFKSAKPQTTSLTFQQLLQIEDSNWSQKQRKNQDQADDGNHHNKKSVLAKVKDKARKLKCSLSGKKHHDENESRGPSTTPPSSVGREEEAKYRSAPMNGPKLAPDTHKQASRDHHREAPVTRIQNHYTTSNAREPCAPIQQVSRVQSDQALEKSEDERANSSSTNAITKAQSNNQPPPDTSVVASETDANNQVPTTAHVSKVHDLPESGSKFSGLKVSTSKSVASKADESVKEGEDMKDESHTWDKGFSMKEYLMHKFEPGGDERELSQVITQTISPRRDKVREVMSSSLKNDEPSESTSKLSNSEANSSIVANDTNSDLKSKPASENLNTKTGSKNVSFSPRHSLGMSNASSNLNQTFKSTIASYQNQNLGSSPNDNTSLNSLATSSSQNANKGLNQTSTCVHSPTKTSSSPLGHGSSANGTRAPAQTNSDATQVHSHTDTKAKQVPISSPNQTQVPKHSETNTIRVPISVANQT
ncbi:hypothetical protein Ccrd_009645 [Cynara cardunculus var. scolymus]|uniref:Uncharacterized protein n=1 Tax=Cynara cardunculus var. scolymus TaxID=59895 RepID=A0A124SI92_CYNCS|nr:hypothetical protein Ccrd_009645 [Cynara cardunculus var. scolymus]